MNNLTIKKVMVGTTLAFYLFSGCTSTQQDSSETLEENTNAMENQSSAPTDNEMAVDEPLLPEGFVVDDRHYHELEALGENVYVVYRREDDKDDVQRLLMRFSPYEEPMVMARATGIDFRANDYKKLVAIDDHNSIVVKDTHGNIIHDFGKTPFDESLSRVQLEGWSDDGSQLWFSLSVSYITEAYVMIDTDTWEETLYDEREFGSSEYVLNPNTGWVVYSDYPVNLDVYAEEEYLESEATTSLYLYNVITQEELIIDQATTNLFEPEWTDSHTIRYQKQGRDHHLDINEGVILAKDEEGYSIYKNLQYGFSLRYPMDWLAEKEHVWDSDEDREASPDGGINLYPVGKSDDQDAYIYVYGQRGHISLGDGSGYEERDFMTDSGVHGINRERINDGIYEAYLILDEEFNGALIRMPEEDYRENQGLIEEVLASIELD